MEFVTCGLWRGLLGHGLAERELFCLLSVAAGHTDKEIARKDGLSPRSIKGRIESAMHKLGVYRRPALVAEAMRRGLISIAIPFPAYPDPNHHQEQTSTNSVFIA
ncbi:LuxR C-terminal-related transcriptional regulator [Pseudomonas sp. V88_4]|uniref:LuxR C-terminal-related transcriptional regulator n=1 Tax=Pseudomonas sp. V88_4 TaxID=3044229 RepID=UPI00249E9F16|nr:LuxR C-terminal-related transcriptional regulator [Pseudomonas sp. V88_4]MDI3399632.1 LuxR C-terminal-related transcriptional regulator [Pseudomonas sp. V88_4]